MASDPPHMMPEPPVRPLGPGWDAIRLLRQLLMATLLLPSLTMLLAAMEHWRGHQADLNAELGRIAQAMGHQAARALSSQALMAAAVDTLLGSRDAESLRQEEWELHLRLQGLRALVPVSDVLVLDPEGRPLASARTFPVPPGQDLSGLPWFNDVRATEADMIGPVGRPGSAEPPGFPFAQPRRMAAGFAGVIAVTADPAQFQDAVAPYIGGLLGLTATLRREDGLVLARYPPGSSPAAGEERLRVAMPVPGYPVWVTASVDASELTRRRLRSLATILGIGLPGSAVLFGTTLLALRRARSAADANLAREAEAGRRRKAEARLIRAQRLEALGQLTGGVAHDFNNLLQVIVSGLAVLDRRPEPARQAVALRAMQQAASRGSMLTRQLLAFARRQALAPAPLDLTARIDGMRELLERSLRQDIALQLDLPPGLWPLLADATQLEVAILNLAVNARDAMPRGGVLRIAARNEPLPPGGLDGLMGEFVRISVSDTGTGMAPDVLGRVFEPFFTTKGPGRGTGLGLAQVYGFARQTGGTTLVESQPGEGTTFHLLLPRADSLPGESLPETSPRQEAPSAGQSLAVLVVEDDEEVGALAIELLEQLGHTAHRVKTVEAALGMLADTRPVDLLFVDVMLPGIRDGLDLVAEAQRRRPGMAVLLTSGYAEAPARVALAGLPLLSKPYEVEDLGLAIRAVMESRNPPA